MIRGKWVVSPDYKDSYIEILTENLLPLRTKADITQEELASMIGISRQTYYAIETQRRQMSWNTYLSLMLFFILMLTPIQCSGTSMRIPQIC